MNDENRLRWQLNLRIGKKEKKLARELSIADSVIISTYYRRGSMEPVIWIHLATNWYSALVRDRQLLQHKVLPVFCRKFIIFTEEPGTIVIFGNIASWPCQPILSLWMFYAGKCVYFSRAEFFITILQQPLTSFAGPRATLGNIGQGSPVDKVIIKLQAFSPSRRHWHFLPESAFDIFLSKWQGMFLFNPDSWPHGYKEEILWLVSLNKCWSKKKKFCLDSIHCSPAEGNFAKHEYKFQT